MKKFRIQYRKQEIVLGTEEVSVGRGEDCGLVIDDPLVSRRHASFRLLDASAWLFDAGSRNGVRVNGVKIDTKKLLSDGDVVAIGTHEIVVTHASGASAKTRVREDLPTRPASDPGIKPANDVLLWRKLDALFQNGEIAEAEKLLSERLHRGLVALRSNIAGPETLKLPTAYSIRLAIETKKSVWIDWVFQAYETAGLMLPAETVDELHGAIRKTDYRLSGVLKRYIEGLRARANEMNPTERFAMQRLEGVIRMLSGGTTGRHPIR